MQKGPLMVIYPEGVWMKVTTKKDIDLIIEKYIKDNRLKKSYYKKLKWMIPYLLLFHLLDHQLSQFLGCQETTVVRY